MIVENCIQCRAGAPHDLHIAVAPDRTVTFTDNDGNPVEPPSTVGQKCPLCHKRVSFIDSEFGNAFCLPCGWMGEVERN